MNHIEVTAANPLDVDTHALDTHVLDAHDTPTASPWWPGPQCTPQHLPDNLSQGRFSRAPWNL